MSNHSQQHRWWPPRLPPISAQWRVLIIGGLAVLGLTAGLAWNTARISNLQHGKQVAVAEKSSATSSLSAVGSVASSGKALAQQVLDKCKTDPAFKAENPTLCPVASQLATAALTPAAGPRGPGPSDLQVQRAVAAYLAAHPPPVDLTRLRSYVNAYLAAHPPPPGPRGPSGASGSPGPSGPSGAPGGTGPPGDTGPPGPSGTNGTDGATGAQGPPGVSVVGVTADLDGHTLTFTFTMSDGATLSTAVLLPAPNGCPATRTITPPEVIPPQNQGDPTSPYPVCVPTG